jgi:hypothetical protein
MNHYEIRKKSEERVTFDLLRSAYPELPDGRIIVSESPDFIIQSGPRSKTGIELTRYSRPGDLSTLSRDHLTKIIRAKEQKLSLYRKKLLNRIFLVILMDSFWHRAQFNIRNQLDRWRIESEFDCILLFDTRKNRVYDL